MAQIQTTITPNPAPLPSIDPTTLVQSESPTAVILAIAILISVLMGGITKLIRVLVVTRSYR